MNHRDNSLRIIERKRDGHELSESQIRLIISDFVTGHLHDYQMSAFAMAVYFRGMSAEETAHLTSAMLESGQTLQWPQGTEVVSKHSTGGVGDKVSLILVPLLAACGLVVPKLSGRGLGVTGGTLDKLESIPGLRTDLSTTEIQDAVGSVGCCITGTTADIAPADQKLYALRDSSGTVPSIPLITSSILSKKLAENPSKLLLDVKFGTGAFMNTAEQAHALAASLVSTGERLGVETDCVITDMNQPLGRRVGNLVEVEEAIEALEGNGESRLMTIVQRLASDLLEMSHPQLSSANISTQITDAIQSGNALKKLNLMIEHQGGRLSDIKSAKQTLELKADRSGYVSTVSPNEIAWGVIELGGGRQNKTQSIDHSVGCEILKPVGTEIQDGDSWLRIFLSNETHRNERAIQHFQKALRTTDSPAEQSPVILEDLRSLATTENH
ncbi:MAG: thymidine phosphorylase [Rubripirellula sp.]|nr:thymidine phosphorylase [Rubripirellula sp.]